MQLDPCVKVSQEPRRRSNRAWTSQVWRPAKLRELKAAEVIFAETNADNGESTSESSHSSSKINNINNDNDNKNEEPGNYESANPSCHLCDNEIQNTNIYPKAFSFLPFPNCKPFKGSQKVASLTNAHMCSCHLSRIWLTLSNRDAPFHLFGKRHYRIQINQNLRNRRFLLLLRCMSPKSILPQKKERGKRYAPSFLGCLSFETLPLLLFLCSNLKIFWQWDFRSSCIVFLSLL